MNFGGYDWLLKPFEATKVFRVVSTAWLSWKNIWQLPLLLYGYFYLQKPFVHGLGTNLLDFHPFKYVWIDTKWRPERS